MRAAHCSREHSRDDASLSSVMRRPAHGPGDGGQAPSHHLDASARYDLDSLAATRLQARLWLCQAACPTPPHPTSTHGARGPATALRSGVREASSATCSAVNGWSMAARSRVASSALAAGRSLLCGRAVAAAPANAGHPTGAASRPSAAAQQQPAPPVLVPPCRPTPPPDVCVRSDSGRCWCAHGSTAR